MHNQFHDVLDQYRLQSRTAKESLERHEAIFKEGLCLLALQRQAEALEVFNQELVAGEPPWSVRAACQLWLIYLQTGKCRRPMK